MGESLLNDLPYTEALEHLQATWDGYRVWIVPLAVGGFTWCCTRNSDGLHLEASGPDELNDHIAKAETGH